jgi:hypothetical protein
MKYSIFILLSFLVVHCNAQSTVNASGGGGNIGSTSFDYSIGEMTLVSTETSSAIVITQGLLQPEARFATNTKNLAITQQQLKVYPNPSVAIVYLQATFQRSGVLQVSLTDLQGKALINKEFALQTGKEKQQIDISSFANGAYLLNVKYTNKKINSINTYKIQKIN